MNIDNLTLEDVRAIMIKTYVPEADQMTYEDALELAMERDLEAARRLVDDFENNSTQLQIPFVEMPELEIFITP
jgi:hypothetical protein